MTKSSRQIAMEILMQVEQRSGWSNLTLDSFLRKYPSLEPRDAAFASALVYGALERRVTLDACIEAHAGRPIAKLTAEALTALRVGMYQLLYLDSTPDHAAVGESVEAVKALGQGRAAGFVNGVLRGFLRNGKRIPLPDGPPARRLSVACSCPEPLVELWLRSYGPEATERLLADSLGAAPTYLRANTLRISASALAERLRERGIPAQADAELDGCVAVDRGGSVTTWPEYGEGLFHVQDKSSQLCALAVEAQPGMRTLDACSAPGGKAFTLMERMGNVGELVATDLHPHRVELIRRRGAELGLTGIRAVRADMKELHEELGTFDRVLCDVPCSGLGVIRRKPEIKYKNLEEFQNLPEIQYKILETSAHYCQAGGRLVYSTCTLNPAENERVAERFLREHEEFRPAELPPPLGGGFQRTLLGEFGADGFYLAAFVRL